MSRHCPDCETEMENDGINCWCVQADCSFGGYVDLRTGRIDRDQDDKRQMPDEIIAWPADVTPPGETALTGTWSARRHYTDEAVTYVRKDTNN